MKNTLGGNLKRIRQLKGISVKDLAEKIKINVQSIYDWERGKYDPTKENLESIAKALGVPKATFYEENHTDDVKASDNNINEVALKVLQETLENRTEYRLVPKVIMDDYEIIPKNYAAVTERRVQEIIDAKNELIKELRDEITELRSRPVVATTQKG